MLLTCFMFTFVLKLKITQKHFLNYFTYAMVTIKEKQAFTK